MSIQQQLTALKPEPSDSAWAGRPNEWVRGLSPIKLSGIAIDLVAAVLGGRRLRGRSHPYKVTAGTKRIDVKVATLTQFNGRDAYLWRNVTLADEQTHLALLAISPNSASLFVIPVEEIPKYELKATKNFDEFQIVVLMKEVFPAWLRQHQHPGTMS